MNVLLEGALAPAAPPAGETAQRRHGNWRQAMEQAQLAEWFQPGRERAAGEEAPAPQAQAQAQASPRAPLRPAQASELGLRHALRASDAQQVQESAQEQARERTPQQDASLPSTARPPVAQAAAPLAAADPAPANAADFAAAANSIVAAVMARIFPPQQAVGELAARAGAPPVGMASPMPLRPLQGLPTPRPHPAESAGKETRAESSAPVRPAAAEAPPPVRVHVDWQGQAAHVWLGVDREQLPNLPGLLRQLEQRLQAAGLRLASVTCNGRAVQPRPTFGGEQ